MNRELLDRWLNPPSRELTTTQWSIRIRVILRAMLDADDRGKLPPISVYRARQWYGGGSTDVVKRQLGQLHEEGFFETSEDETRIVPYADLFQCPKCHATARQAERRGRRDDVFDPSSQPCRAE